MRTFCLVPFVFGTLLHYEDDEQTTPHPLLDQKDFDTLDANIAEFQRHVTSEHERMLESPSSLIEEPADANLRRMIEQKSTEVDQAHGELESADKKLADQLHKLIGHEDGITAKETAHASSFLQSGDANEDPTADESDFGLGDTGKELGFLAQIADNMEATTKNAMNDTRMQQQQQPNIKPTAASSLSSGVRADLEKARSNAVSSLSQLDPELLTLNAADVKRLHAEHKSGDDEPDDSVLMARTKTDLDELQDLATPADVKLNRLLRQQDTLDYSVRMAEKQRNVAAPSSFVEESAVPQDFVDSMKRMSLMSSSAMHDISLFGDDKPHFSFLDKGSAKHFDPDADLKHLEKEREDYMHSRPRHMAAPSSLVEEGTPDSFADIDAKLTALKEKTNAQLAKLHSDTASPLSFLQMSENRTHSDHDAKRIMLMDLTAKAIAQVQQLKSKLHSSEPHFDLAGMTSQVEAKVAEHARAGVHAIQNELVTGRTNYLKMVAPMLQTSLDAANLSHVEQ